MPIWQRLALISGLLAVAIFARSAAVVALLLLTSSAAQAWNTSGTRKFRYFTSLALSIPLLMWIAFSAAWSLDPPNTIVKLVFLFFLVASISIISLSRGATPLPPIVAVGLASTLVFSALEAASDQFFFRHTLELLPSLGANIQRQLSYSDGKLVSIGDAELNRRTAIACLLIVPACLAIFSVSSRLAFSGLVFCLAVALVVLFFWSTHQSSQFAILGGLIILIIAFISRQLARRIVTLGWIAAVLLILPIAASGTKLGLHKVSWLPDSAKHRIIIWDYIADQYTHKPILGIGAGATEAVHATKRADIEAHQKALGPWVVGINHSHNAYLEIWYELGVVGAVLLLVAGLTLLRRIAALPDPISLIWQVQFAVIATQIAFSYSIWQPWYQASIALSIFMTKLACDSLLIGRKSEPVPAPNHKRAMPVNG